MARNSDGSPDIGWLVGKGWDRQDAKGAKHALRVLRDILFFEPKRPGTSLKTGFDFLNQSLSRRAIVFFVSDWLDSGYESAFRLAARKHDLIAVRVSDPREETHLLAWS